MRVLAFTPATFSLTAFLMCVPALTVAGLPEKAARYHRDFQSCEEGVIFAKVSGSETPVYGTAGLLHEGGRAVDEKTLFEIGSITKAFTGILLADAVLKKKATLGDPVSRHLPPDLLPADSPLRTVTLLDLTTHTSGLPRLPGNLEGGANRHDPYAHFDEAKLQTCLKELTEADFSGRGEVHYSNLGVGLLGYLLERIMEKPYPDLVDETIFQPLGMTSSFVQIRPGDIPESHHSRLASGHAGGKPVAAWHLAALAGAGGIVSSAHDMMLFAQGHWSPSTPAALREAMDFAKSPQRNGMGLGWFVGDEGLSHDGGTGGFRSELRISPPEKTASLTLTNGTGPAPDAGSVGDYSGLAGYWEGTLVVGAIKLRQVVRISPSGRIVLHSLDQGGAGIPANKTLHEAGVLHAVFGGIGGTYEAKREGETLVGSWKQGGDLPLTLTRAKSIPPALVTALGARITGDPAALQGYWSGYLGGKGGLFVILEIDAFDGTGEARVYSPDQTPEAMPVSSLAVVSGKLTLTIDSIQAAFTAELEADGTISGSWRQGPLPLPLTLSRSASKPERE